MSRQNQIRLSASPAGRVLLWAMLPIRRGSVRWILAGIKREFERQQCQDARESARQIVEAVR